MYQDLRKQIQKLKNAQDHNAYGSDMLRFGSDVSDPAKTAVVIFLVDCDYNGESFGAGDVLFGDNSTNVENMVYKNNNWRMRVGATNIVTFGAEGIRLVSGGLSFQQNPTTVTSGALDLVEPSGGDIVSSDIYISASAGAFSLNSIAKPLLPGLVLFITNDTANNMTIVNGGVPPNAFYWSIDTQTGADVATTGKGIAMLKGNNAQGRWDLVHVQG